MRGASVEAIEQVYRERAGDLFRYSLALTGNPDVANDAVQEGFARALRSRRSYRAAGSLDAWIARCVCNAARDLHRREDATVRDHAVAAPEPQLPEQGVRAALRQLPLRQREALFLRFYLDLDYASIAEVLAVEIGTVSATLHAARQQLGRVLQEGVTQ